VIVRLIFQRRYLGVYMQEASSRSGKLALGRGSLTFVTDVWLKILILTTIFTLSLYLLLAETITVGVSQNPPKTYWREGGEVTGIFVDILDHIANSEGWEINYVKDTWDNNLKLLEQNKLDLVADVAFSPERAVKEWS
jgi:ABC-type amino acid transport substrate-binding protein